MTPSALPRARKRRQAPSLTPPQIAARYGIHVDKVLGWVRSGELVAVNVARKLGGRPRWSITPEALAAFEAARSSTATVQVKPQRRRAQPAGVIEYF